MRLALDHQAGHCIPDTNRRTSLGALHCRTPLRIINKQRRRRSKLCADEPRYLFEQSHPEWSEPADFTCLTKSEYDRILVLLDRIRPKGRLVKGRESISYVTNMTARHTERYEHATLIWGEVVDPRLGDNAPLEVRWLRLISS